MQAAIEIFRENIQRVRSVEAIYQALNAQTTAVLDLSDLLRSELVMAVSSLDHYVHELVRLGILEAYHGKRQQTEAFLRFQISLGSVLEALSDPSNDNWLENQIISRHNHLSFQTPDNVADAIRLIADAPLWNEVAVRLGKTNQEVREQLRLIVNRRNQIVHTADIDPSYPGQLWQIDYALVEESVTFIENLAEAIDVVVG